MQALEAVVIGTPISVGNTPAASPAATDSPNDVDSLYGAGRSEAPTLNYYIKGIKFIT